MGLGFRFGRRFMVVYGVLPRQEKEVTTVANMDKTKGWVKAVVGVVSGDKESENEGWADCRVGEVKDSTN